MKAEHPEETMSFERVKAWLDARGMADRAREFDVSSATVPLAALAVGVEEARIAKTLSFRAQGGGALLIVAAGDARVNNTAFKARFGYKARMLTAQEAVEETGHAVGGVCPFALKPGVQVCREESLRRVDSGYPACGSANSAVRLSPDELQALSGGEWVDVCAIRNAE